MVSAHDDGLYASFAYFDYEDDVARLAAEQELLYSALEEERNAGSSEDAEAEAEEPIFKDADFAAGAAALYRNPYQPPRGALPADMIEWNSICKLEIDGISSPALFGPGVPGVPAEPTAHVVQGALKNCWFIGACGVLATKPNLVKELFVGSRDNAEKGFYTVKFSKCGLTRYVHIDDRVPCNRAGKVHYARTRESNETWLMLLEKAYAKLHGCYENLAYGCVERGLRDLTSWPTFKHDLASDDGTLWDTLSSYLNQPQSLVCVEFSGQGRPGDGILAGHAYTVLDMKEVHADATASFDALDLRMVKLHNPWGMADWTGSWSKSDESWANYPEIKAQLNPAGVGGSLGSKKKKGKAKSEAEAAARAAEEALEKAKADAEIWISWEDLVDHFTTACAAVNVRPPSDDKNAEEGTLAGGTYRKRGTWRLGSTMTGSGGSPEHNSWSQNPQYAFEVESPTIVTATLSLQDGRFQALPGKELKACIGFVIMKLTGTKIRSHNFHPQKMVCTPPPFQVTQSISAMFELPTGRYVIVPSTFEPESEPINFVLEVSASRTLVFEGGDGDAIPDADEADDSDDEALGPIDGYGIFQAPADKDDPENNGKELEALSMQAGELAYFMKTLIRDVKGLEDRVNTLMPPPEEEA